MTIELRKVRSSYFSDEAQENEVYDYHCYDIIAGGETVGTVDLIDRLCEDEDDNDICYIERIDVYEQYRNRGIGTEVLTSSLYDSGYRTVIVAPDNEDAKRLYERIGQEYTYNGAGVDFGYNDQGYGVYSI